jgi:XRE family aerobic/anaerobic benzoate catabolism transcriptional regulator
MDDLVSILKSREPLYARADIVLDTAGKAPERNAEELASLLNPPNEKPRRRSA